MLEGHLGKLMHPWDIFAQQSVPFQTLTLLLTPGLLPLPVGFLFSGRTSHSYQTWWVMSGLWPEGLDPHTDKEWTMGSPPESS